mgnify:FL=1
MEERPSIHWEWFCPRITRPLHVLLQKRAQLFLSWNGRRIMLLPQTSHDITFWCFVLWMRHFTLQYLTFPFLSLVWGTENSLQHIWQIKHGRFLSLYSLKHILVQNFGIEPFLYFVFWKSIPQHKQVWIDCLIVLSLASNPLQKCV